MASADNPYAVDFRDELIRLAATASVQPTMIARDSGLSRSHVYRIING